MAWVAFALLAAALLTVPSAVARAQSDDERLEEFLGRLGLAELQMTHLEERVTLMPASEARTEMARRLADLYAQALTENLTNSDRYQQLGERVERLLSAVPEARTAALEVMLLQVDYQRAESLIRKWLATPNQQHAHDEAQAILERITPRLQTQDEQLWKLVEQQVAVTNTADANAELAERELLRRQSIAARASYYTGWSLYYRSILGSSIDRNDCTTAIGLFRKLLDLTDEDRLADLDAASLGLESPWRARAMIGLGMCEAALGNTETALQCFDIVDSDAATAEVRDQAAYWCLQAFLLAGNHSAALDFARERIVTLSAEPTEGKISFCAALISAVNRPANSPAVTGQLSNLGVRGLARMRQYSVLHELLRKYKIAVDDPEGFLLLWLQGQQRLDKAQQSKKADDYQAAAESLRAALEDPDASGDLAAASHCRQQLAWAYYNLGKFVQAIDVYRQAAEGLKAVGDPGAVEAGWMSFVSANRLVEEDDGSVTIMHDAANWLNKTFPGHDHSRRAMFLVTKLRMRDASPEERLRALRNIAPDDPNFSSARQEICAAVYEQWREASDADKPAVAQQVNQVVNETLSATSLAGITPHDQLLVRLMAADVNLSTSPADLEFAREHLEAARNLAARSGIPADSVAEYHFRALQLARAEKELDAILEHTDWYLKHGLNTRFESPALILAAKSLEQAASGEGNASSEMAENGLRLYARLSQLLGDTREAVAANRNAQVALSRLAHYAYQVGERHEAAEALEKLLLAFPKDRAYLRRAGLIHFELRQFEESLDHWRTILAGSRSGTAPWFEAKYYQIACLLEVDREAAATVFKQFQLLAPELGPPEWRDKFQALQQRL